MNIPSEFLRDSPVLQKGATIGVPGWLSRLSVRLQLRSWYHSSWVRALHRALCSQLRAWSLLQILCLPSSLSLPGSLSHSLSLCLSKINKHRGAWVAQSVKRSTSAQVTISWSMSSSLVSGSGLTAQSLEPASDSVSPSLSAPPPFMLCLCLKNK